MLEVLERHNRELNERIAQMHSERIINMDNVLDLYEREIQIKVSAVRCIVLILQAQK